MASVAMIALWSDGYRSQALATAFALSAMIFLPPLVGFALFFCLMHSPAQFAAAQHTLRWRRPAQWGPVIVPLTCAALGIAALVFLITKYLLKISIYIPAPLIAIGIATILVHFLPNHDLTLIKDKYGSIPSGIPEFTGPDTPTWELAGELAYYAFAFAFVCGFEGLLCARMADKLANNKGTTYNPDKEFWAF